MSSPFDPPAVPLAGDRPPLASPLHDPHVVVTATLFGVYALFACGMALLLPAAGVIGMVADLQGSGSAADALPTAVIVLFEGLCIGGIGLVFVSATGGVLSGRKWGWALGLVASALWMANLCCMPFGAYCLFALLRKRVRAAYGIN